MKVLINSKFEAVRKGTYVVADESENERIFDSELEDLTVLELKTIYNTNIGPVANRANKSEIIANLAEFFNTMELPTMNDKTDSQKVEEIVAAGVEAESSDDDMLIEIIQAGIKFKVAGRLFKDAMEKGGYRITAKARKEQCREILVEAEFNPETYDEVQDMMDQLVEKVSDTTTSQAYAVMRAYAKEFEIELPKPVKKAVGGLRAKVFAWIIENPTVGKADLEEFIKSQGEYNQKQFDKHVKAYFPTLEVANAIAAR